MDQHLFTGDASMNSLMRSKITASMDYGERQLARIPAERLPQQSNGQLRQVEVRSEGREEFDIYIRKSGGQQEEAERVRRPRFLARVAGLDVRIAKLGAQWLSLLPGSRKRGQY